MPVELGFALGVRRLHRQGLTEAEIAQELGASLAQVNEAHRMLDLPSNDRDPEPSTSARKMTEDELDRIPKKIADRMRRTQQQREQ